MHIDDSVFAFRDVTYRNSSCSSVDLKYYSHFSVNDDFHCPDNNIQFIIRGGNIQELEPVHFEFKNTQMLFYCFYST